MDETKPLAVCPRCSTPLVSTFEFSKKEWVCLACPAALEWLEARSGKPTPTAMAEYEKHRAAYDRGREERRAAGTQGDLQAFLDATTPEVPTSPQ